MIPWENDQNHGPKTSQWYDSWTKWSESWTRKTQWYDFFIKCSELWALNTTVIGLLDRMLRISLTTKKVNMTLLLLRLLPKEHKFSVKLCQTLPSFGVCSWAVSFSVSSHGWNQAPLSGIFSLGNIKNLQQGLMNHSNVVFDQKCLIQKHSLDQCILMKQLPSFCCLQVLSTVLQSIT